MRSLVAPRIFLGLCRFGGSLTGAGDALPMTRPCAKVVRPFTLNNMLRLVVKEIRSNAASIHRSVSSCHAYQLYRGSDLSLSSKDYWTTEPKHNLCQLSSCVAVNGSIRQSIHKLVVELFTFGIWNLLLFCEWNVKPLFICRSTVRWLLYPWTEEWHPTGYIGAYTILGDTPTRKLKLTPTVFL